ncbi:hypothetical protein BH11ACT8_BH11ACT8_35050 [soil metagenome]
MWWDGAVSAEEAPRKRTRNAERTKAVIVEALIEAFQEGELRPTAKSLAERAGVSLRSIYVHFADLDELRLVVAQSQLERIEAALPELDPLAPLEERVSQLITALEGLYAIQGMTRLVAMVDSYESAALDNFIRQGELRMRDYLRQGFRSELARDSRERLGALEALTSPTFRYLLIERQNLPRPMVARIIRDAIVRALTPDDAP